MNKTIVGVAVAFALGLGFLAWYRQAEAPRPLPMPPGPPPVAANAPAPVQAPMPAAAGSAPSFLSEAPAYAQPSGRPAPATSAPYGRPAIRPEEQAPLEAAVARLNELQRSGRPDARAAIEAIKEIEAANGSPVVNGVRFDALRHNLEVAEKMQELGKKLEEARAKGALTPEAMKAQMEQLAALQSQLRQDVMVQPPGAVAVAAPAAPAMSAPAGAMADRSKP